MLFLSFRDFNFYEKLFVDRFVRFVFFYIGEFGLVGVIRVFLILDGLDECKTFLDFFNIVVCIDFKKEI